VSILKPGTTCARLERADRVAFLIDGQDYFTALESALKRARRQILILGWSFDTRARPSPGARDEPDIAGLLVDLGADPSRPRRARADLAIGPGGDGHPGILSAPGARPLRRHAGEVPARRHHPRSAPAITRRSW